MIAEISGIAALAIALFSTVALALIFFMILVQPIWCIIDCAIDRKRSGAGKAIWIIALILLWGVINWFYGAFAAAGTALRTLTRAAWIVMIVLIAAFLFMYQRDAEFRRGIEREWQRRGPLITVAVPVEQSAACRLI